MDLEFKSGDKMVKHNVNYAGVHKLVIECSKKTFVGEGNKLSDCVEQLKYHFSEKTLMDIQRKVLSQGGDIEGFRSTGREAEAPKERDKASGGRGKKKKSWPFRDESAESSSDNDADLEA